MVSDDPGLRLPPVPQELADRPVAAWREPVTMTTYSALPADRFPPLFDKRVYQGSSGRVYPLALIDGVSTEGKAQQWDAVHLENRWLRVMVLPSLGGRIHVGLDKTNDYDFFYRNNVIKPALVGLAGPWVSGGVEFNWPQHHRPATYLPTDVHIEEEPGGSVTVWCSDHDPFSRMKGMHGIRLSPESSVLEVRVRLFNRSPDTQTFLWWANAAVAVGDEYQSFFPPDVRHVVDHAKRAVTAFPRSDRPYYGIDYPARATSADPDADRLDWWRNIPVPTSYMSVDSTGDFFGGYDHAARAGVIHWADHLISPGKKQWTWGNSAFGRAWERCLTDDDGPYVELMAGVFTDNQPDFAFLAPGETRSFTQCWYPFRDLGPVQEATRDGALAFAPATDGGVCRAARLGVATTREREVTIEVLDGSRPVWNVTAHTDPSRPFLAEISLAEPVASARLRVRVCAGGVRLLEWRAGGTAESRVPQPATEPPAPEATGSVDQLYLNGQHLEQYRHATRAPEEYWRAALRRDPEDSRCNVALGRHLLRQARYAEALRHLETALGRVAERNANPRNGEAHYLRGQVLGHLERTDEARESFGRASWTFPWRGASDLAISRIDARAGRTHQAVERLRALVRADPDQLQVRNLLALLLRREGSTAEASDVLHGTLAADPLDWWARDLATGRVDSDPQTILDIALEYRSAGAEDEATRLLRAAIDRQRTRPVNGLANPAPVAALYLAESLFEGGDHRGAREALTTVGDVSNPNICRLQDVDLLERSVRRWPDLAGPPAMLGDWLYTVGRREEALVSWRRASALDPEDPVLMRNLGVGAMNVENDPRAARSYYDAAVALAPDDPRLRFEADQLAKRLGASAAERWQAISSHLELVEQRDDLTLECADLLTRLGQPERARQMLAQRRFQPWEGGEGRVVKAWEDVHVELAAECFDEHPEGSVAFLQAALDLPPSLAEERHPLANHADLHLALGDALAAAGRNVESARGVDARGQPRD